MSTGWRPCHRMQVNCFHTSPASSSFTVAITLRLSLGRYSHSTRLAHVPDRPSYACCQTSHSNDGVGFHSVAGWQLKSRPESRSLVASSCPVDDDCEMTRIYDDRPITRKRRHLEYVQSSNRQGYVGRWHAAEFSWSRIQFESGG